MGPVRGGGGAGRAADLRRVPLGQPVPRAEPEPGKATLVEFHLKPIGDAVEVTLVESGFAGLEAPDDVRAAAWKDNTDGWQQELAELRTRAEAN